MITALRAWQNLAFKEKVNAEKAELIWLNRAESMLRSTIRTWTTRCKECILEKRLMKFKIFKALKFI